MIVEQASALFSVVYYCIAPRIKDISIESVMKVVLCATNKPTKEEMEYQKYTREWNAMEVEMSEKYLEGNRRFDFMNR